MISRNKTQRRAPGRPRWHRQPATPSPLVGATVKGLYQARTLWVSPDMSNEPPHQIYCKFKNAKWCKASNDCPKSSKTLMATGMSGMSCPSFFPIQSPQPRRRQRPRRDRWSNVTSRTWRTGLPSCPVPSRRRQRARIEGLWPIGYSCNIPRHIVHGYS